jgi:hypothetical protein
MAEDELANDMLEGIPAISRFLNIKTRQGYALAEAGRLPLFKLGKDGTWRARKSWRPCRK